MSPTYSVLPKYAPFSPFGDGGMLFHTGRFFACQDRCPADASWSMYLSAATEDRIILDGKAVKAEAHWIDRDDGRSVYVGQNVPQQTDDFIAVLDAALPERIRGQLLAQLPGSCTCSGKLGVLPIRPMLFVSTTYRIPKGGVDRGAARSGLRAFLRQQVACRDGKSLVSRTSLPGILRTRPLICIRARSPRNRAMRGLPRAVRGVRSDGLAR